MSRRFWLIDLLLILIFLFLVVKVYDVWTHSGKVAWEAPLSRQKPQSPPAPGTLAVKKEVPPPNRYQSISEKNLFNPERKEFASSLTSDGRKALTRPDLELFGVVVGGEYHSAIISNPDRKLGKGQRETITVKVGDRVGGYQVAKILEDRIVLEMNGDAFDLLLYDPSRPKKRPAVTPPARPAPTPVTPTRPATPPSPGGPQPQPPIPSQPPVLPPAGIGQAPLPSPPGREVPRRDITRQRPTRQDVIPAPSGTVAPPE